MCQRLVVRFLPLQREIAVMMRLGNRPDALDDRLPVIAFILAVEDIAVRGAGEDRVAAVPRIHRHAFDVGANMFGQSAGQNIPTLTAVTAARDARVRGVEFSPGTRTRLGAGDEEQVRITGMDEERVDVADAEI